ncbi:MAG: nucleotidyltransferase domain-containing protein [Myxococcota bacterium]|jgi:predicted nucleotidyltransferase
MTPRAEDERIARELASRLVATLHARRVVWFGSRARGEGDPESDWDVLVVAESAVSQAQRMYLAQCATADVRVPKDIVVFTPDEYARLMTWKSSVVYEAETTGRVLHEAA